MSPNEVSRDDLMWLVGLLEGEGSFCYAYDCSYKGIDYCYPRIILDMCDYDVVERAHKLLGTVNICTVQPIKKDYKTHYKITLKGSKAVLWMNKLYPYMSIRRKEQINQSLKSHYTATNSRSIHRYISYELAEEIRKAVAEDRSLSNQQLAERFKVSKSSISRILLNKTHRKENAN